MSIRDKLRILVVDDMSTSRGLITQALDTIGITNYWTENDGQVALKWLAANPVHLVLSDFNMPNMDGLQLLESIRRHAPIANTGFILVTGRADQEIVSRGTQLRMNNFIKKPFTVPQIRDCIEKVVGRL